jgi:tetratricopeptide (TPR) repeat protein
MGSINRIMGLATVNSWMVALTLVAITAIKAGEPGPGATPTEVKAFTKKNFQEARNRHQAAPEDVKAAWQFARACFDLADLATNRSERAEIAELGIAAGRQAVAREPKLGAAHYYLGMALAQLAQTKSLGALRLVGQMEHEFSLARELDERLDYGGPDRNLGLLYRDAPALGSIGSRPKARQHLRRAVELAGDYPENQLNLIEAYLKWGERKEALTQLGALEETLEQARTNLTGIAWSVSWADWGARLKAARSKLGAVPRASANLKSAL